MAQKNELLEFLAKRKRTELSIIMEGTQTRTKLKNNMLEFSLGRQ